MKGVAEQKCYIFLELYHSVCGQRFLANVGTAEQLWLEWSQDQVRMECRLSGRKLFLWNDQKSIRKNFWDE